MIPVLQWLVFPCNSYAISVCSTTAAIKSLGHLEINTPHSFPSRRQNKMKAEQISCWSGPVGKWGSLDLPILLCHSLNTHIQKKNQTVRQQHAMESLRAISSDQNWYHILHNMHKTPKSHLRKKRTGSETSSLSVIFYRRLRFWDSQLSCWLLHYKNTQS